VILSSKAGVARTVILCHGHGQTRIAARGYGSLHHQHAGFLDETGLHILKRTIRLLQWIGRRMGEDPRGEGLAFLERAYWGAATVFIRAFLYSCWRIDWPIIW